MACMTSGNSSSQRSCANTFSPAAGSLKHLLISKSVASMMSEITSSGMVARILWCSIAAAR